MSHDREVPNAAWDYVQELFALEDNRCLEIIEDLKRSNLHGVQVSAVEAKLLQVLLGLIGATKVVEVGTLFGYSALWIARGLPQGGKLWCLEKEAKHAQSAHKHLEGFIKRGQVEILEGDAHSSLEKLVPQGPFDAVFIDAEKSGYAKYLDWAEEHVRPGGLIVGDNTFLWGDVYRPEHERETSKNQQKSMIEFNRRLSDPKKFRSVLIPTPEGMTVAQKL